MVTKAVSTHPKKSRYTWWTTFWTSVCFLVHHLVNSNLKGKNLFPKEPIHTFCGRALLIREAKKILTSLASVFIPLWKITGILELSYSKKNLRCKPRLSSSPKVILFSVSLSIVRAPPVTLTSCFQWRVLMAGLLRSSIRGRQIYIKERTTTIVSVYKCVTVSVI